MPRTRRERGRITIGSRAVAVAILGEAIREAARGATDWNEHQLAEALIRRAWDVEYKPTSERLIITLDAGITYDEDDPHGHAATYAEIGPDDVVNPPR